jgi:bacillithiol biosynthesis cysteine-adding enzyme BshC
MVTYNAGAMPGRPATTVLQYGAFRQPLSLLFRDYLEGRPKATTFYGGGRHDLDGLVEASERALGLPRETKAVSEALARQQEARGASRAAERASDLGRPGATAIVTGQQAGLVGGPLFVLFKAIATIKTARLLQERRGKPVVPVFWVASDDHDFAEIRSVTVLDESGQIRSLRYSPRREPVNAPAWAIELDDTLPGLLDELQGLLPDNAFRQDLMARLSSTYAPKATLSGAFARLLSGLFPELVVMDPADAELKRLALPVMRRELQEGSPTSAQAIAIGDSLLAAGYHQQVPVRPGFFNLFAIVQGERRALRLVDGAVEVRGLGERWTLDQALAHLERDPSAWSAGVLLRPLVQDALLPTAAYVGGPAEIAYNAQLGGAYAHFGIPRPALVPRPSLTLIDPAPARALEAEGLGLLDLEADPEGLVSRFARDAYPEVEGAFQRTRDALTREMTAVEEALGAFDPTLKGAAESARGRALHQVEGLYEKSMRALKKRDQARAERLRRTRDALFPGGALQERGIHFVSALARHGEALLARVDEAMDPWALGHQVLPL